MVRLLILPIALCAYSKSPQSKYASQLQYYRTTGLTSNHSTPAYSIESNQCKTGTEASYLDYLSDQAEWTPLDVHCSGDDSCVLDSIPTDPSVDMASAPAASYPRSSAYTVPTCPPHLQKYVKHDTALSDNQTSFSAVDSVRQDSFITDCSKHYNTTIASVSGQTYALHHQFSSLLDDLPCEIWESEYYTASDWFDLLKTNEDLIQALEATREDQKEKLDKDSYRLKIEEAVRPRSMKTEDQASARRYRIIEETIQSRSKQLIEDELALRITELTIQIHKVKLYSKRQEADLALMTDSLGINDRLKNPDLFRRFVVEQDSHWNTRKQGIRQLYLILEDLERERARLLALSAS